MAEGIGSNLDTVSGAQQQQQAGQEEQQAINSEMALPGFRFHPTEEELVGYYLKRMVQGRRNSVELIASLDLYQYDPWELPAMAFMGEKEWFFFCPRDKKYPNGARPNRVTGSGYWKATGTDRAVRSAADSLCIGLKKTLVFYTGRAPRGHKTDWIMNEYRMPKLERSYSSLLASTNYGASIAYCTNYDNFGTKNDVALCRIYRKSSSASSSATYLPVAAREVDLRGAAVNQQHYQQLISNLEFKSLVAHQSETQRIRHDYRFSQPTLAAAPSTTVVQIQPQIQPQLQPSTASPVFTSTSHEQQQQRAVPACNAASSVTVQACGTSNNLRSSHALMARVLVEDSTHWQVCDHGRNCNASISLDAKTQGSSSGLQNALRKLGMTKLESGQKGSPTVSTTTNTTEEEGSLESEGSCIDIFHAQLRQQQHQQLDHVHDVDLRLKSTEISAIRVNPKGSGCTTTTTDHVSTTNNGITLQQQRRKSETAQAGPAPLEDFYGNHNMFEDEVQSLAVVHDSCNNHQMMQQRFRSSFLHHHTPNPGGHNAQATVSPQIIWRHVGHTPSNPQQAQMQVQSTAARLGLEAFSGLPFLL